MSKYEATISPPDFKCVLVSPSHYSVWRLEACLIIFLLRIAFWRKYVSITSRTASMSASLLPWSGFPSFHWKLRPVYMFKGKSYDFDILFMTLIKFFMLSFYAAIILIFSISIWGKGVRGPITLNQGRGVRGGLTYVLVWQDLENSRCRSEGLHYSYVWQLQEVTVSMQSYCTLQI